MTLVGRREIIQILIACSCLTPVAVAQKIPSAIPTSGNVQHTRDFSETVVPITSVKIKPSVKLALSGRLAPDIGLDEGFGLGVEGFAAHSPLLDSLKPAFVRRLPRLIGKPPIVPLYSGWSGGLLHGARFSVETPNRAG